MVAAVAAAAGVADARAAEIESPVGGAAAGAYLPRCLLSGAHFLSPPEQLLADVSRQAEHEELDDCLSCASPSLASLATDCGSLQMRLTMMRRRPHFVYAVARPAE